MTLNFKSNIENSRIFHKYIHIIFYLILNNPKIEMKTLIQRSRLPINLIKKILSEFKPFFYYDERNRNFIILKHEYINQIKQYFNQIKYYELNDYSWVNYSDDYIEIKNFLLKIIKDRKPPKRNLDQFPATIDTIIRRVLFLKKELDISQSSILFVGDYDLTSIAFAKLNLNKEIVVIDIDEDLINYINTITDQYSLAIKTYKQDLRLNFSSELSNYLNKFDVIFTDPPYTISGISLFLYKSLQLLNSNYGVIYLCFGYSIQDLYQSLKFQYLIITEFKLFIRCILENFNTYEKAFSIGSTSHLYKIQSARRIKLKKDLQLSSSIYTGYSELNKKNNFNISYELTFRLINHSIINKIKEFLRINDIEYLLFFGFQNGEFLKDIINSNFKIYYSECNYNNFSIEFMAINPIQNLFKGDSYRNEIQYQAVIIETPISNLDVLINLIKHASCKLVVLFLDNNFLKKEYSSVKHMISRKNWFYLKLFWDIDYIQEIKSNNFEPYFPKKCYFHVFKRRDKKINRKNLKLFILRELFMHSQNKVKNGILKAILKYYNQYYCKKILITKRQAKKIINNLDLSKNILELKFSLLNDDEFLEVITRVPRDIASNN
ncbi:MAG: bis-aminopropyl spermidine synthase family protein [Candidatus Helarchaeota archaeon]